MHTRSLVVLCHLSGMVTFPSRKVFRCQGSLGWLRVGIMIFVMFCFRKYLMGESVAFHSVCTLFIVIASVFS